MPGRTGQRKIWWGPYGSTCKRLSDLGLRRKTNRNPLYGSLRSFPQDAGLIEFSHLGKRKIKAFGGPKDSTFPTLNGENPLATKGRRTG
ncbi:hypothetical protein JTE90_011723 [Oedothorax gibbosus]|uniref:Uncharacterized protein n=1 Tax=Oedothorax gibbosus TaxID=931172 RepID=A0AAV6TF11_9ARAC|nr:hypothetical protein JTE90_011723 [Oedothorax gibbosus]